MFLFDESKLESVKKIAFTDGSEGMVALNVLRKALAINPSFVVDEKFVIHLFDFMKKNFAFGQEIFYLEFFHELVVVYPLVHLLMVDCDLITEFFQLLQIFCNEVLRYAQNELTEEQNCYQDIAYLYLSEIFFKILSENISKPYY